MNPIKNIYNMAKIITLLVVLYFVWPYISSVVGMLVIALLVTTILLPTVDWLEGKLNNRILAVLIVILLVLAIFFTFFSIFIYEIGGQTENVSQQYFNQKFMDSVSQSYQKVLQQLPSTIREFLEEQFDSQSLTKRVSGYFQKIIGNVVNFLGQFYNFVFSFIMTLLFTIMLLAGYHNFKRSIIGMISNRRFELSLRMSYQIEQQLSNYLRAQLRAAARIAALTILFLLLLNLLWQANIKMVVFLGLIAGLASLIPIIGTIIAMLPTIFVAIVFNLQNPVAIGNGFFILHIIIIYLIIQKIDKSILSPVLVSKKIGLHPIIVLIALIVGANLYGPFGMLLAVPIAGIIKVIVNESWWFLKKSKKYA
jgi:predicted PurR-regulated permease PerM